MAESKLPRDFEARLQAAAARSAERARWEPTATGVRYEAESGMLVVRMAAGPEVRLPVQDIRELREGTPRELAQVGLRPDGTVLTCAPLDADVYLPRLLADALGLTAWWNHHRAAEAGRVSTAAKTASSRANGRRGGRPAHVTGEPEEPGTLLVAVETARGTLEVRAGSNYRVGAAGAPAQRGRHVVAMRLRGERDGRIEARFTDTGLATLVDPAALEEEKADGWVHGTDGVLMVAEPREPFGSKPTEG
ncbi:MAG TPA: DUF2442 domain-containing protein [Longimicrobiaceae bacterium]|nr:DUF2442 domain-containing protein [Longimicrobiaceae bacterium]